MRAITLLARRWSRQHVRTFTGADLRLHLPAELERGRDVVEDFLSAARPRDRDGAKIQHTAEYSLIHADVLDLSQHRLHRATLHESHLDDHTLVRHGEFRRGV